MEQLIAACQRFVASADEFWPEYPQALDEWLDAVDGARDALLKAQTGEVAQVVSQEFLEEVRHALTAMHGLYICDGVNAHEERFRIDCSSVLEKLDALLPPLPPAITYVSNTGTES